MRSFFSQLLQRPATKASRLIVFTQICGFLYIAIGLTYFFTPSFPVNLGLITEFQAREEGLFRLFGFACSLIGYFYVFGARTHACSFALSTILDRFLVPFFGYYLYQVSNIDPMIILPLCILDPLLGLVGLYFWSKDKN